MKIKNIEVVNHPILRNLSLDFTDNNGNIVDTIILAGENGCGKTTILELIFRFGKSTLRPESGNEQIKFVVTLNDQEIYNLIRNNFLSPKSENIKSKELTFTFDFSRNNKQALTSITYLDENNNLFSLPLSSREHLLFRVIFSNAEINFKPKKINHVTTTDLDMVEPKSTGTTDEWATELTQLFVDIQSLDNDDLAKWVRNNPSKPIINDMIDVRLLRFKEAFNYMFSNLQYKEIRNIGNFKKVIFDGPSGELSIEDLSSGEKQIVFRGGFILKDKKKNQGTIVLIDEPEISMHPRWQEKIGDFYKLLLTNEAGIQQSQLFMATHSPFIVHNHHRFNDKIIVLSKDSSGLIKIPVKQVFCSWTDEKIVEQAFNIPPQLDSSKTNVFVEGDYDIRYLNKAAELLDKTYIFDKIILKDGNGSGNLDNIWKLCNTPVLKALEYKILVSALGR